LASPALAGLCSVHAAFSYRDSPAGVPPAGRPLLRCAAGRCWSLLALTGMLEGVGVGKGALSSEFSSAYSYSTVLALSQIRPCNTTPSGQAWSGSQICTGTTPPACLDWQLAVVIVWGLLTHDSHQPGRSLQLHQAHLTRYCVSRQLSSIQRRSFARLLQPSFLHSRAVLQLPKKLCRLGKTASRHSSAAGRAGHPICRLCNVNSSNCRTLL
jgi:hypothetical protein